MDISVKSKALRVVGESWPRIDSQDLVTGKMLFTEDVQYPRMLYGKILGSPLPHARIISVDSSHARAIPGVVDVITGNDVPQVKFGIVIKDQEMICRDKVRFVGDAVAAVVATSPEAAEEALDAIKVEYEQLPAVFEVEEALNETAVRVHDKDTNIAYEWKAARGDISAGFEQADLVFEETYSTSCVHATYIEPTACIAHTDASGNLTILTPIQYAFFPRKTFAEVLGIPVEKIRIVQTAIGGGFGGKIHHSVHFICAFLALRTGRPVKMVLTREEEFAMGLPRVPMQITLKMGFKNDGTITAKETKLIADNGAYTSIAPPVLGTACYRPDSMYRIRNIKTDGYLVYTNKIPTGSMRGFGNTQMTFALESHLDEAAKRLGLDPVEIRLRNAVHAGDITAHGWVIKSCGLSDCIKMATQAAGWDQKRGRQKHLYRGIGLASCIHVSSNRAFFSAYDGGVANLKIDDQGRVVVFCGEVEIGQGCRTIFAQIAAEELGITPDRVIVARVDTDTVPFALGTFASRVTFDSGNAVKKAAEKARALVLETASCLLEVDEHRLDLADGFVFVKDNPDMRVSFAEIGTSYVYHNGAPLMTTGVFNADSVPPDPVTKYGNMSGTYSFAAQVAEVEIDPETGHVKVLNFVAAHDVGKAINPMSVEGQVEGGIAQGIGYALLEEIRFEDGKVVNPNLTDFKIPTALDVPASTSILVETIDPAGPYGAKSVGEPALVPTAPAIVNAIQDAIGVRFTEIPVTPEKVLAALGSLLEP